jgi:hypothetical protein
MPLLTDPNLVDRILHELAALERVGPETNPWESNSAGSQCHTGSFPGMGYLA